MHPLARWTGQVALAVSLLHLLTQAVIAPRVRCAKTRWFVLHSVANFAIALMTCSSFVEAAADPAHTVYQAPGEPHRPHTDCVIIGALHLYHFLAFPVDDQDKYHHLLFIPFNQACVWLPAWWGGAGWSWGPCIQMQHFFICGLPGAIDYMVLALSRLGRVQTAAQKLTQVRLNLWLRCPGVLFTISVLLFETVRCRPPPAAICIVALDAALIGFNSLYYTDRVVRSHERYLEKHPAMKT